MLWTINPMDQRGLFLNNHLANYCLEFKSKVNINNREILHCVWVPSILILALSMFREWWHFFSSQIKIKVSLRQGIPSFLNFYNCVLYLSFSYASLTSKWCGKIVGSGSIKNRTILISPIWHISINKRCLKREALKGFHLLI